MVSTRERRAEADATISLSVVMQAADLPESATPPMNSPRSATSGKSHLIRRRAQNSPTVEGQPVTPWGCEGAPPSPGFSDERGYFLRQAQLSPCLGISLWLPPKAKPPFPFAAVPPHSAGLFLLRAGLAGGASGEKGNTWWVSADRESRLRSWAGRVCKPNCKPTTRHRPVSGKTSQHRGLEMPSRSARLATGRHRPAQES